MDFSCLGYGVLSVGCYGDFGFRGLSVSLVSGFRSGLGCCVVGLGFACEVLVACGFADSFL